MSKRQTRRSISVKGVTYQRLKNYCESQGMSISGFLEEIIAARLDAEGVPIPDPPQSYPVTAKPKPVYKEDVHSQHFSF